MNNKTATKTLEKTAEASEMLGELSKLYEQAVVDKNYQLCDIIRLEIQRCILQKPLLIPAGQIEGFVLDL